MGKWTLECPKGGKYECEGGYRGGHGQPFELICDSIRTLKEPEGLSCVDELPDNVCKGGKCKF